MADFLPFSQSHLSNQFLTYEDGSELLSFTTWASVSDLHRRCIIPPLRLAYVRDMLVEVSTCIRRRDIVIASLVRVCVCVSVCLHLKAS